MLIPGGWNWVGLGLETVLRPARKGSRRGETASVEEGKLLSGQGSAERSPGSGPCSQSSSESESCRVSSSGAQLIEALSGAWSC